MTVELTNHTVTAKFDDKVIVEQIKTIIERKVGNEKVIREEKIVENIISDIKVIVTETIEKQRNQEGIKENRIEKITFDITLNDENSHKINNFTITQKKPFLIIHEGNKLLQLKRDDKLFFKFNVKPKKFEDMILVMSGQYNLESFLIDKNGEEKIFKCIDGKVLHEIRGYYTLGNCKIINNDYNLYYFDENDEQIALENIPTDISEPTLNYRGNKIQKYDDCIKIIDKRDDHNYIQHIIKEENGKLVYKGNERI